MLIALGLLSLIVGLAARDDIQRVAFGAPPAPADRKAPSDILEGDEGPTDPRVGTVPTLPGACPILGDCAPPVEAPETPDEAVSTPH